MLVAIFDGEMPQIVVFVVHRRQDGMQRANAFGRSSVGTGCGVIGIRRVDATSSSRSGVLLCFDNDRLLLVDLFTVSRALFFGACAATQQTQDVQLTAQACVFDDGYDAFDATSRELVWMHVHVSTVTAAGGSDTIVSRRCIARNGLSIGA